MKKRVMEAIVFVMAIVLGTGIVVNAATVKPDAINSQGRIVFDNDTEDSTDDVIFDASDLYYLYSICQ